MLCPGGKCVIEGGKNLASFTLFPVDNHTESEHGVKQGMSSLHLIKMWGMQGSR